MRVLLLVCGLAGVLSAQSLEELVEAQGFALTEMVQVSRDGRPLGDYRVGSAVDLPGKEGSAGASSMTVTRLPLRRVSGPDFRIELPGDWGVLVAPVNMEASFFVSLSSGEGLTVELSWQEWLTDGWAEYALADWLRDRVQEGAVIRSDELNALTLEVLGQDCVGRKTVIDGADGEVARLTFAFQVGDRGYALSAEWWEDGEDHLVALRALVAAMQRGTQGPQIGGDEEYRVAAKGVALDVRAGVPFELKLSPDGPLERLELAPSSLAHVSTSLAGFHIPANASVATTEEPFFYNRLRITTPDATVFVSTADAPSPAFVVLGSEAITWRHWIKTIEGEAKGPTEVLKQRIGGEELLGRRIRYTYDDADWSMDLYAKSVRALTAVVAADVLDSYPEPARKLQELILSSLHALSANPDLGDG